MKYAIMTTKGNEKQTIGKLELFDNSKELFSCYTLELPWRDNKRNISCIPGGTYIVKWRYSEKYKFHFHVTGVKDRTYILIHAGNFYSDLKGCIAVGDSFKDINKDGIKDILNSRKTLVKFLSHISPDEKFELKINRL
jgi:hypothetical protein